MAVDVLDELARLIEHERDALLAAWRAQIRALPAARDLDVPTLNDHIPELLAELASALRAGSGETIAQTHLEESPPAHGLQRVKDAFDIEEVVAEYNILRGCIHDLADRNGLSVQGRPFHVLNRVLDGAIGSAVRSFATQKALEVQQRREEYLEFVAHDLRTPLSPISISARVLETLLVQTVDRMGPPSGGTAAMNDADLVNALAQYLDLEPLEKQALLERNCLRSRAESLVELLEMKIMMARTPGLSNVAH